MSEYCNLWTMKFCCFWSYYLEHFAIDPTCIDHYTRTVAHCSVLFIVRSKCMLVVLRAAPW